MMQRFAAGICVLCLLLGIWHVDAKEKDGVQSAYHPIDARKDLSNGVGFDMQKLAEDNLPGISTESQYVTGLGDDSAKNLEYTLDFGLGGAEELKITCTVRVGGKIRLYQDCHSGRLLQEFTLSPVAAQQTYTFPLEPAAGALNGVQTIALAFDNNMKFLLQELTFVQGTIRWAYTPVRAVECDEKSSDLSTGVYVENPKAGSWLRYKHFNFDRGIAAAEITYANLVSRQAEVYFRLDSPDGEIFAQITQCNATGASNRFQTYPIQILGEVTGVHDVYITFSSDFGRIESFSVWPEPIIRCSAVSTPTEPDVYTIEFEYWGGAAENVFFAIALYDQTGRMLAADMGTAVGRNAMETELLTIRRCEQENSGCVLKGFLWDKRTNAPLCPAAVFDLESYSFDS